MKRVNRNPYDEPEKLSILGSRNNFSRDPDKKCGLNLKQTMGFFLLCLILFVLFSASVVLREPPSNGVSEASTSVFQPKQSEDLSQDLSYSVELSKDELMGGLLGARIDGRSCVSRYMSGIYGKGLLGKPSSYLISRLKKYEALHKECEPYTECSSVTNTKVTPESTLVNDENR